MRTLVRRLTAGAALAAAAWLLAGVGTAGDKDSPWKPVLPEEAYKELVTRAAKVIEANADSKDEDARKMAQVEAVRVAAYTLSAKGDAGQLAAARRDALKAAALIAENKDGATAKKLAAGLAAVKADPAAGADTPDFVKAADLYDLMNLYRTKNKGGEGLHAALQATAPLKGTQNGSEEKVRYLARKKMVQKVLDKEADELALFAYKVAVDGAITAEHTKAQKKDAKQWRELSIAMRDAGVALAEAAKKKDAEGVHKASTALDASCSQCHSAFRGK